MKNKVLILFLVATTVLSSCGIRPVDGPLQTEAPNTEPAEITETVSEETEAEATVPVLSENATLSFAGVGDNIIYYGTYRDAAAQAVAGGRKYNFAPIYDNVREIISGADLAFVNQETNTANSLPPADYPNFNSPVDLTYDVMDAGFDIVNLANNHMLDNKAQGIRESYDSWVERGAFVIGCYEEKSEGRYISYLEKNGIKIAFVSYTYGTNLNHDPAEVGLWAPYLKQSDVAGDVKEADENADFVIVSVHWGAEGAMQPSDEQRQYAQIMADNGADVILGHHPHVLQPIEWITGENGGKCLAVFSLGNFVHEQARDYNVPGGIITFDIVRTVGRTSAENVLFIPTVCHYPSNFYNNKVYLFKDYTSELASAHAVRTYYKNSISYDSLKKYITDTVSAEFLPEYMQ